MFIQFVSQQFYFSEIFRWLSVFGDSPSDRRRNFSGKRLGRIRRETNRTRDPGKLNRTIQFHKNEVALDGGQVVPGVIVDDLNDSPEEVFCLSRDRQVVVGQTNLNSSRR